jgi:site-specific recombinase XerD
MKALYYKLTKKWRILIPPSITGTGKRQVKYFDSKAEADAAIGKVLRSGPPGRKISETQHAALSLAKELGISEAQILDAVKHYQKTVLSISKPGTTLEEACMAYMAHHDHEQSHAVTKRKYRGTLRRLCAELSGYLPLVEVTKEQLINVFLKQFKPGGNRAKHQSNLRAFFNWATENQYLAINPLANVKMLDQWEPNKEILAVDDFRKILLACAAKYHRLLPYFVLGGFAGIRRAEMISSEPADRDPRIEWSDIDFKLNKIRIRHEVAKETLAVDRRRSIPLEPAAKEWLQLVAKTEGPVMQISQSTLQREKAALLDQLGIKVPENALRNSYASYGCAFRSIGDVARAMGDLEVTVKRYYVDLVDDPELGRAWFNLRPSENKIISIGAAAFAA